MPECCCLPNTQIKFPVPYIYLSASTPIGRLFIHTYKALKCLHNLYARYILNTALEHVPNAFKLYFPNIYKLKLSRGFCTLH